MASKQTRKAITKTVRFEVFKRDSFTCQYCGRKAPEAVLNVDHIKPVAFDSYGVFGDDGQMDLAVASKCWNMVGGILRVTHDNPDMKELYYIRGILRNRLNYVNERDCLAVLKQASGSGMPLDELKRISRQCRSWSAFKDQVYSYLGVE